MDIKIYFNKLVNTLDLGNIIEGPTQLKGGLTHKMFKIYTNKGKYVVKLLNPNIMKRPTAINKFTKADFYEGLLKQNNIKAIYSLTFNNKKMQEIDGQYFYVYDWYDGKSLKDSQITEYHCEKIGKVLAQIHNIDLVNTEYIGLEKNIDFKYYIELAQEKKSPIYELISDKLEILNKSINKGNETLNLLPKYKSICHNDMDSKNVLWIKDDYKLIDLECLGYSNPYLECYELALCWSGYETCDINFDLFKTFLKSYFNNIKLEKNINWESIYYANNGRLEWLEFNIKRALMIECDNKDEQQIGLNEVKETIEHVIYYDKVKDDILNSIKEVVGEIE